VVPAALAGPFRCGPARMWGRCWPSVPPAIPPWKRGPTPSPGAG